MNTLFTIITTAAITAIVLGFLVPYGPFEIVNPIADPIVIEKIITVATEKEECEAQGGRFDIDDWGDILVFTDREEIPRYVINCTVPERTLEQILQLT